MAINDMEPKEKTVVVPETGEKPVIKVEAPQEVYETNRMIVKDKRVIWYVWLVVEILLFLRFILHFFGANPWNFFTVAIEFLTFPFMLPFMNTFSSTEFGGNNQIEWSVLFAMFVYLLIAIIASRFFKLKKPVDPLEARQKVEGSVI